MPNEKESCFWRGFGSTLVLRPHSHAAPRFIYRGRDIAKTTASDALSGDWDLVAASIAVALRGDHDQDESESQ